MAEKENPEWSCSSSRRACRHTTMKLNFRRVHNHFSPIYYQGFPHFELTSLLTIRANGDSDFARHDASQASLSVCASRSSRSNSWSEIFDINSANPLRGPYPLSRFFRIRWACNFWVKDSSVIASPPKGLRLWHRKLWLRHSAARRRLRCRRSACLLR
jgi:hypothetical protein